MEEYFKVQLENSVPLDVATILNLTSSPWCKEDEINLKEPNTGSWIIGSRIIYLISAEVIL